MMEKYNSWINFGIGIMVVADWIICFILARNIAIKKGHSPQKSLFFAILGPFSLFRFLMEGISTTEFKLPGKFMGQQTRTKPISQGSSSSANSYDKYREHYRFQELLGLVAYDEVVATRLISLEQNQNPTSNLDRWIDLAIFRLEHDRGAHQFQYVSEEYD